MNPNTSPSGTSKLSIRERYRAGVDLPQALGLDDRLTGHRDAALLDVDCGLGVDWACAERTGTSPYTLRALDGELSRTSSPSRPEVANWVWQGGQKVARGRGRRERLPRAGAVVVGAHDHAARSGGVGPGLRRRRRRQRHTRVRYRAVERAEVEFEVRPWGGGEDELVVESPSAL